MLVMASLEIGTHGFYVYIPSQYNSIAHLIHVSVSNKVGYTSLVPSLSLLPGTWSSCGGASLFTRSMELQNSLNVSLAGLLLKHRWVYLRVMGSTMMVQWANIL